MSQVHILLISSITFFIFTSLILSKLALIMKLIRRKPPRTYHLPPGPKPLPIVGNLLEVGPLPHRSLRQLSQQYGPLMRLQLGQIPTIVVSSAHVAQEVLKTQDHAFSTRPPMSSLRRIFYDGFDIAFCPSNAVWRQARRICTSRLLSSSQVQLLRPIREEEIGTLVKAIRIRSPSVLNLSDMFVSLLNNITCREVFGHKFDGGDGVAGECGRSMFHDLVTEWTSLMGHFNMGEYFPSLDWINHLNGLHRRFRRNFEVIDAFLDKVVDAHVAELERGVAPEDEHGLISVLLRLQRDADATEVPLTKQHVKAILMDLFIAGTDTGAISLEWAMSELTKNPQVRQKAQAEIRSVVVPNDKVEECDLHKLRYLKLVVKETFRLHPPAPFLLPRQSRQECLINGYDIPAKSRITVNVWAIGRDPATWEDAEVFSPERFEDSPVDFRGQHFELLPFGAGRRGCPGVALGAVVVELALANLLHAFDWRVEEGKKEEELDMGEAFGIVIRRKSPLRLIAIPVKA